MILQSFDMNVFMLFRIPIKLYKRIYHVYSIVLWNILH